MTSLRRVAVWTLVASAAWSACQVQAFGWRDSRKSVNAQGSEAEDSAPDRASNDTIVLASAQGRPASGMSVSLSMPARYLASAEPTASPVKPSATPSARTLAAPVNTAPASGGGRFDLVVSNAPASQVFLQLGAGTSYNMLVSPEVTGLVSLSLRGTTVPEALEALKELYGYDFRIASGNRVFVYSNQVQTRLFKINYLPGRRQGASELSISSTSADNNRTSSTMSGGSSSTLGSTSSGGRSTTSSVQTTTDNDFWRDVRISLTSLVGAAEGRTVTLNPAAGVIVVRATPAELRQVADYLRAVQLTIERQVMLEAKIVEVKLSDGAQTGVNWSLFRSYNNKGVGTFGISPGTSWSPTTGGRTSYTTDSGQITPSLSSAAVSASANAISKGFYGLAFQTASFSALMTFLESQGEASVLSSPRIAALNNQKAVLKVGRDETFVTEVANTTTNSTTTSTSAPTVKTSNFFSGISLDVTPQIDDNGAVMLHVHPAISVASQKDLSVTIQGEPTSFPGVQVSINETDSIVRVRDGEIVAIGGLMQQESSMDRAGVPGLSRAPVVGGLFGQRSRSTNKYELVILIKPTVIGEDGRGWSSEEPVSTLSPAKPAGAAHPEH
ncbi:MAG: pilus (MSHA type) biogenesis protein MshL [Pseudomonadota bacterium]